MEMIITAIVGGVIGWASGFLPFVEKWNVGGKGTQMIVNIIMGIVGGTAGASLIGGLLGGGGSDMLGSWQNIVGSLVGAGALSTVVGKLGGLIKK